MERITVSGFLPKEFRTVEALKTLRTNLMFYGDEVKVVGLTSFSAAEGKSTLAFQLAASLAQMGRRVLLLDADLRKSVLPSRLQVRGRVIGLSDYLAGTADVSDLLYETDMKGFYILFAGGRVPNAAEALGGSRFKKLMSALRNTFDYVIVDAAPIGQVVDCAIIAPALDGVLTVIDGTNNSYQLERRMINQLEKSGARILGAILNRVDFQDQKGYYGKAYDYGADEKSEKTRISR